MCPLLGESDHNKVLPSYKNCRSSCNVNEITIDVIELEKTEENIKVKRAWVFHDDIFILITEDDKLFTSVEVSIRIKMDQTSNICLFFQLTNDTY